MSYKAPTTGDEQLELARRAKSGDRSALCDLVESQNGLIRQIAVSYAKQSAHLEIDDLIQEGYLAVLDAVRWFDPERGYRFSTYAGDCARRRMFKWVQHRTNIPIGPQERALEADSDNPMDGITESTPEEAPEWLAEVLERLPPLYRAVIQKRCRCQAEDRGDNLGLSQRDERNLFQLVKEALQEIFARSRTDNCETTSSDPSEY